MIYKTCSVLLLCLTTSGSWAGPCYFKLGAGMSKVIGIKTTSYEDKLFANRGVTGSSQVDGKSHTSHFGGGCDLNRYLSLEADYREGIRAVVSSHGSVRLSSDGQVYDIHSDGGSHDFSYGGQSYNVSYSGSYRIAYDGRTYERNFDFKRFATVRGYTVSGLARLPLSKIFEPYVRLGIMAGVQQVGVSSSMFPEGVSITMEKTGVLPLAGLGIRVNFGEPNGQQSGTWFLTGEKTCYADGRRVCEWSGELGIRF